ncbi:MAG: glycosyltransferase family 92 protein [Solirubrobacterales bacterium]
MSKPGAPQRPPHLSVCAIYRDEAPYLREWIEFHRLVGVERFFLYNNDSQDAHRAELAPYVDEGVVELRDWPFFPGQLTAYEDCLKRHRDDARWIAFIDLDEFLFSPTGRPVSEVLAAFDRWPGVVVNWAVFGTSGHLTPPAGLVIENYVQRSGGQGYNCQVKSIVDPRRVANFCSPHFFTYRGGNAVDENQRVMDRPRGWTDTVSFSLLRVNHYVTRSEAEYLKKLDTPTAAIAHMRPGKRTERAMKRRIGVLNEMRDETIQMYLPQLRQAIARVGDRDRASADAGST